MTLIDRAQAAATENYRVQRMEPVMTLSEHKMTAFVEGVEWATSQPPTKQQVDAAARTLNHAGWTCHEGSHEPGQYDDCSECRDVTRTLALAALTAAHEARA